MNKNKGRGATGVCQSLRYQFGRDDQNQVFSKPTLEVRTLCGLSHIGTRRRRKDRRDKDKRNRARRAERRNRAQGGAQGAGEQEASRGREKREKRK